MLRQHHRGALRLMISYPLSAQANGAGIATVSLPTRAIGRRWIIKFISVQSTSVAQSQAGVYLNKQLVIATSHGNFDSASGDPPIPVTGKDDFQIQWTGCDANAQCTATLWYDDAPSQ